jgi:processive 1,2-diacylglycerol beta-glucosyltransferase
MQKAKRIMLMYISEVSGHRSAAEAIGKALKAKCPSAEILGINAFKYTNPITEKIINRIYMGVIKRAPGIWEYLYDNPQVIKKLEKIKTQVHRFNAPKLKRLFGHFKPDAVVCTQAFPCGMVADYKQAHHSGFTLVAVLTDYVPHSYWIYDTVDYYIAPSEEISRRMANKGVAEWKIKPFGIPFDQKFNQPNDKKDICRRLRLNPDLPILLIMGGGQGLGPINSIIDSLEETNLPLQEIIVTGTNRKLYSALREKAGGLRKKNVVFGFSRNVHKLMDAADIIITKPGGVTCAEALTKGLPMIIVHPIPGQEANNAGYLMQQGAAIRLDDPEETGETVEKLFFDPAALSRMRQCASRIAKPNASSDIAQLLLSA